MKESNKWLLAIAAAIMMAATWVDGDFSAFSQLSKNDLVPVIVITAVIFLIKTGVLSALLILLKKLWDRIRKK